MDNEGHSAKPGKPAYVPDRRKDAERIAMLEKLGVSDADNREFDTITRLAHRKFGAQGCAITFIDDCNQWAKSTCGVGAPTQGREVSFCEHGVQTEKMVIVEDASMDPRFRDYPLVTGPAHLRFYAGVPLRAGIHGADTKPVTVGMLCLYGNEPRTFTEAEREELSDMAILAEMLLELRLAYSEAQRSKTKNDETIKILHREQRQFKQAERMANFGSWRMTFNNNELEWSEQVYAIHEVPLSYKPILKNALEYYPEDVRDMVAQTVERTIETGESFELETDFYTARNRRRRVRSMGELELLGGKPVALIGVFQDITQQYELEQALRRVATTDELTQLPNRAECNRVVDEKISQARAIGQPLALLLLDLDGFKKVNDVCGHHRGDELLRSIARTLRASYLSDCFSARLGGDEFVIVVSSPQDCVRLDILVKRLLDDLRHTVSQDGVTIQVSGSIGICWLDNTIDGRSELMKRADKALYAAKNKQRGTSEVYEPLSG